MEELSIGSSSNFINDSWFKIKEYASWNVLSSSSFREESVERVITSSNGLVRGHLTIGLNTVFQTVQFPAGITDLNTGLTNMNGNTLTHVD